MNAGNSVIRVIVKKKTELYFISCVLSEAKCFVDDNHGNIREHWFSMQNCRNTADPLGRIAVCADTGFCTGCFHAETFCPHGTSDISHALKRCLYIHCQLVDTGNDHDLAGAKGHGIGAIADTVHIDDFAAYRDSVGTTEKAVAGGLIAADLQRYFW